MAITRAARQHRAAIAGLGDCGPRSGFGVGDEIDFLASRSLPPIAATSTACGCGATDHSCRLNATRCFNSRPAYAKPFVGRAGVPFRATRPKSVAQRLSWRGCLPFAGTFPSEYAS